MRLTDHPRTLAEMKPDVAWPAALQATLDKALARDAEDRYASAAQFGREFSAAIADMPMTRAVEAGTAILGAVASAKSDVPSTRVAPARPSGKTLPMDAVPAPAAAKKAAPTPAPAAAPAKKSVIPLMAGGGIGLVAVGMLALKLMGPAATPAPGTGAAGDSATLDPNSAQTATTPTVTNTVDTTPRTQGEPIRMAQQGTNMPGTRPAPSGTSTAPLAPPTAPTGPAPAEVQAKFDRWIAQAQDSTTTPRQLQLIYAEIEALRPKLSGSLLAESWYVEMIARASEGDLGACAAADQVLKLHTNRTRREAANLTKQSCP